MKKTETLSVQFWVIVYITREVNFMKITENLLVQFWVLTDITSEFHFCKKIRI